MKSEYKINNIQKVILNSHKATMFDVFQLIDNTWVYQFRSKVFAHRSTVAGIETQIMREASQYGHDAGYIL